MNIIDVSVPVRPGMVTYPGDPVVELERTISMADGAAYNVSRLAFGVHTGTHVDAPVHFVDGGAGSDELLLDVLVGPATVFDATAASSLDAETLETVGVQGERVLLKTRNSELWSREAFAEEFLSLREDGAKLLVERGVQLVGIDYLSIGDEAAHQVLLEAGVVPVEGLDLSGVAPGDYGLVCAPLKLVGSDGAPARVFLTST
ncbi:MAG TPA: cyclase family protein [Gaiellaceae bacterium]|nr:cyclase family protein [Gaiellaceae bacterium]